MAKLKYTDNNERKITLRKEVFTTKMNTIMNSYWKRKLFIRRVDWVGDKLANFRSILLSTSINLKWLKSSNGSGIGSRGLEVIKE